MPEQHRAEIDPSQSEGAWLEPEAPGRFSDEARAAIRELFELRRDVRHFKPGVPLDEQALASALRAAHLAPSVGFSQPWGFVLLRERGVRERIRQSFLACRAAEAARFPSARRAQYLAHKLEGLLECAALLCVCVDLRDREGAILGTTVQPEAVRASVCCAVQNFWLAARAEGLGVGWVSIVEPAVLRQELRLPLGVEPVALLCLGEPLAFRRRPMLEESGWEQRRALREVLHLEHWPAPPPAAPAVPQPGATQRPEFDHMRAAAAQAREALLAKPSGSLGRLELLASWYLGARGARFEGRARGPLRARLCLFAADHGVCAEGVSAYGSSATAAAVLNVLAGGAAANQLARSAGAELVLFDVGVAGDLSALPRPLAVPFERNPLAAGTCNLRRAPALSAEQAHAAMAQGAWAARAAAQAGIELLLVGEIGMGNTTSAAALVCALTGASPDEVVGRGTGVSDAGLAHKRVVVADALALHAQQLCEPFAALCALGGFELAAIVGALLEAPRLQLPVLLDGFPTNAAALVAARLEPRAATWWCASHTSAELGAQRVLAELTLEPLLSLGLRLGEGTGALLALPLIQAALAAHCGMATFATSGIRGRNGTPDTLPLS